MQHPGMLMGANLRNAKLISDIDAGFLPVGENDRVRRMPMLSRQKRLVGVVSLGAT